MFFVPTDLPGIVIHCRCLVFIGSGCGNAQRRWEVRSRFWKSVGEADGESAVQIPALSGHTLTDGFRKGGGLFVGPMVLALVVLVRSRLGAKVDGRDVMIHNLMHGRQSRRA